MTGTDDESDRIADLARQHAALDAFEDAETPEYKLAWAQALWAAWVNVFGDDRARFARSYPEDATILDAAERGLTDADLEEMSKPLPPGPDDYDLEDLDDDGNLKPKGSE